MQPNNNLHSQPAPPPQPTAQPIHDVAPVDAAANDITKTGAVFSDIGVSAEPANPIAGTTAPQSGVIHEQSAADQSLDGVLRQVTSNIKATPPAAPQSQKKKRGFFGGGNKAPKKPHPAAASHGPVVAPVANPIHQAPPKPKKPILAITFAIFAAIGLATAAVMAYK